MKVNPSIYAYRCRVIANAAVYNSNVTTMEPLQELSRKQKQSSKFIPRNRVHPTHEFSPSKRLILGCPTKKKIAVKHTIDRGQFN